MVCPSLVTETENGWDGKTHASSRVICAGDGMTDRVWWMVKRWREFFTHARESAVSAGVPNVSVPVYDGPLLSRRAIGPCSSDNAMLRESHSLN